MEAAAPAHFTLTTTTRLKASGIMLGTYRVWDGTADDAHYMSGVHAIGALGDEE